MTNVWRGHGNRLLRFHRLWKKNEIRMPESNVYGYMYFCFFVVVVVIRDLQVHFVSPPAPV